MNQNNNRIKKKSLAFEGLFIVINQILNIILFFINIGFGNDIIIILTLLNSLCGLIFGIKYGETFLWIYNIFYIIITMFIYLYYFLNK